MVQAFGALTFGLSAASLALSAAGVWYSIRLARRVGVIDVPNERSSHATPTPRMGGVPMVIALMLAYGGWTFMGAAASFPGRMLGHAILYGLAMSLLGFWDDLSNLSPLVRFLLQVAGALLLLWAGRRLFPEVPVGSWALPAAVGVAAAAIWIVWMLNLYNFMDGIDGLAGGEAVLASSFFFVLFARAGETGWAAANLFIAAAALGFLVHNWPPARVFMGDAGSGFLGAFYGMQSVAAALTTPMPFAVLVLPFANFILDTSATLIRRVWRGEKWYLAHRSHFYQRMTNLGMSHRRVTVIELLAVALSCAAAASYLSFGTTGRVILVFVVAAGFGAAGIRIAREERRIQQG